MALLRVSEIEQARHRRLHVWPVASSGRRDSAVRSPNDCFALVVPFPHSASGTTIQRRRRLVVALVPWAHSVRSPHHSSSLAVAYSASFEYLDQVPGLLIITVIDTFLSVGLMAFSVYAGTGLWSIRSGAVQMAKRYLLCFLVYSAVAAILPFMAGLPSEANEAMVAQVAKDAFRAVIFVAVWYSYLNKSKRVSATYHL